MGTYGRKDIFYWISVWRLYNSLCASPHQSPCWLITQLCCIAPFNLLIQLIICNFLRLFSSETPHQTEKNRYEWAHCLCGDGRRKLRRRSRRPAAGWSCFGDPLDFVISDGVCCAHEVFLNSDNRPELMQYCIPHYSFIWNPVARVQCHPGANNASGYGF